MSTPLCSLIYPQKTQKNSDDTNLVVFPEMIGTWLVLADEWLLQRMGLLNRKHNWLLSMLPYTLPMLLVIVAHLPRFLMLFVRQLLLTLTRKVRTPQHRHGSGQMMGLVRMLLSLSFWIGLLSRVVILCKADRMMQTYVSTFSWLAQQHKCYIVAGSILLPRCGYLEHGIKDMIGSRGVHVRSFTKADLDEGLYNMCMVFDPSGDIVHISHKQFPVEDEIHLLNMDWQMLMDRTGHGGSTLQKKKKKNGRQVREEVPDRLDQSSRKQRFSMEPRERSLFHCDKIGNVGILICADAWYPESYEPLIRAQCRLVIVPSFSTPAGAFFSSWPGHSNIDRTIPEDVDLDDVENRTLAAMWEKYALAGVNRIGQMDGAVGVCCHCVCSIYSDMTAAGQSYICTSERGTGMQEHCEIVQRASNPFEECILVHEL